MRYLLQLLIAIDQLLNAIIGGWADETISSRSYRWARDGKAQWPKRIINGLFFWQENHCHQAFKSERMSRHQPPELRD